MKKYKWLLAVAALSSTDVLAQEQSGHIDVPTDGILILMGLTTLVLLFIILRLISLLRKSMIAKQPALRQLYKKGASVIALLLISSVGWAQTGAEEATEVAQSIGWFGVPMWIWIIYILTIIVELVAIQVLLNLISQVNIPEGTLVGDTKSKRSFFDRINNAATAEEEAELDLDHDYDGISELDNRIPQWWLYAFYATIIMGLVYAYRFIVLENIPTQLEQLDEAITKAEIEKRKRDEANGGAIDENTATMADAAGIEKGQSLFYANCRACHGDEAQGAAVGPNLTDEYWLHGGSLKDVFHSISAGWPDKGMQSWQAVLSPSEIQDVASYIMSVQGTNPPNSRSPQGEKYEATNTEPAAESDTSESTDSTSTEPAEVENA